MKKKGVKFVFYTPQACVFQLISAQYVWKGLEWNP